VNVIAAIMGTADDLIVGRVLGAAELGLYVLAYRLPELLIFNLSTVAGQVLFPAMATLDRSALPGAVVSSLRYGLMVGLPLTVGLVVLAEPVTLALFGEKWHDAAAAMRVMAVWTLMAPIAIIVGTSYKAMGRPDIVLKLAIPQGVLLVGSVLLVADEGIVAVAAWRAAIALAFTTLSMIIATRVHAIRARDYLRAAWPAAAATAALAAVVVPVERLIDGAWPALLAGVGAGGVAYLGTLWLVARDEVMQLVGRLLPSRGSPEVAV